jgi:hypothetical protein
VITWKDSAEEVRVACKLHWADMCRTLRIFGYMDNYSKAECLRINRLLKKAIKEGRAEQVSRGCGPTATAVSRGRTCGATAYL